MNIKKIFGREGTNKIASLLRFIPDETYLKLMYRYHMGQRLDFDNPKTFNEKLQWLKIHNRKPIYTTMVDKYEVKDFVSKLIGSEYLIPSLGVWERFEDIDFSSLSNQFVLKCTHDSGGLIICKDKDTLDREEARKKIERSLKTNFFWVAREWPYKNVQPRILAEQYMKDNDNDNLPVYKVFNFGGEPYMIQAIQDDKTPNETIDYFDLEWNRLPFTQNYHNSTIPLSKPPKLDEMLNLARKLSAGQPHIRTDFFSINGSIYFSEFTFFSDGGFKRFNPPEWDRKLGDMIDLRLISGNGGN